MKLCYDIFKQSDTHVTVLYDCSFLRYKYHVHDKKEKNIIIKVLRWSWTYVDYFNLEPAWISENNVVNTNTSTHGTCTVGSKIGVHPYLCPCFRGNCPITDHCLLLTHQDIIFL